MDAGSHTGFTSKVSTTMNLAISIFNSTVCGLEKLGLTF